MTRKESAVKETHKTRFIQKSCLDVEAEKGSA